jgi:hypothetical protein
MVGAIVAAQYGIYPIVQWTHEQGCPWDATTSANAAEMGHLEILQWCRPTENVRGIPIRVLWRRKEWTLTRPKTIGPPSWL